MCRTHRVKRTLPCAYIAILLMVNSGKSSCCTSPFTDCPPNCKCSQLSASFLIDCSSIGMESWPQIVPNCTSLYINMSRNKLRKLEYREYMTNAIHIDASHNQLWAISETFLTLGTSSLLETLLLDHNEFTTLSEIDVAFMQRLKLVSIHDNMWNCGCGIKYVLAWLVSIAGNATNRVHNSNGTQCFLPKFYTRRPIVSLDENELCKTRNQNIPIWLPVVITITCVIYLIAISFVAICIVIRRRQKIVDVSTH